MNKRHAFTLIEMLVVIAIMGIIAALVVNMNSGAQTANRNAQVNADKNKLILMIGNYQSKLNFYPPDNGNLATTPLANYDAVAAINPLLYELTGATNSGANITLFDGTNTQGNFQSIFNRSSVNNANQDAAPQDFFNPGPKPQEYTFYPGSSLNGLIVPVTVSIAANAPPNFWHYDSSSPNRHNLSSYDLWAEYISASHNGSNVITINGNW